MADYQNKYTRKEIEAKLDENGWFTITIPENYSYIAGDKTITYENGINEQNFIHALKLVDPRPDLLKGSGIKFVISSSTTEETYSQQVQSEQYCPILIKGVTKMNVSDSSISIAWAEVLMSYGNPNGKNALGGPESFRLVPVVITQNLPEYTLGDTSVNSHIGIDWGWLEKQYFKES